MAKPNNEFTSTPAAERATPAFQFELATSDSLKSLVAEGSIEINATTWPLFDGLLISNFHLLKIEGQADPTKVKVQMPGHSWRTGNGDRTTRAHVRYKKGEYAKLAALQTAIADAFSQYMAQRATGK